jgi:23S rRNA pseudouridine2605 synthase
MASCGIASRRGCERIIDDGHVTVNGEKVADPAMDVDPDKDEVLVKGIPAKPSELVYYALNKPAGYTCSRDDKHAKLLVNQLVPAHPPVWSVGRLDRDTSGLIVMTNDGALTQILTHPSYEKEKEYLLTTDTRFTDDQISEARAGVPLEDGMIVPEAFDPVGGKTYRIVVHEGRNRLIRRFAAYFGKKTTKLSRTRIAGLDIGELESGDYRPLTPEELKSLTEGLIS